MPRGPKGEKRADVIGAAVMVGRITTGIATGEVEDTRGKAPNRAKGGRIGGRRRAEKLTAEQRSENCPESGSESLEKQIGGRELGRYPNLGTGRV
jgi:hypothetical protein